MKRGIIWFKTFSEQIVLDEKDAFYQTNRDKILKIVLTKGIGVEPLWRKGDWRWQLLSAYHSQTSSSPVSANVPSNPPLQLQNIILPRTSSAGVFERWFCKGLHLAPFSLYSTLWKETNECGRLITFPFSPYMKILKKSCRVSRNTSWFFMRSVRMESWCLFWARIATWVRWNIETPSQELLSPPAELCLSSSREWGLARTWGSRFCSRRRRWRRAWGSGRTCPWTWEPCGCSRRPCARDTAPSTRPTCPPWKGQTAVREATYWTVSTHGVWGGGGSKIGKPKSK